MGLLDVFRWKDEINQLKRQLMEKNGEVSKLQSQNTELDNQRLASQQALIPLEKSAVVDAVANAALRDELEQAKVANGVLANDLESLRHLAVEREVDVASVVADLNKKLADVVPEIAVVKAERDRVLDEIQQLRVTCENKAGGYQESEAKLAEKSKTLLLERQKFQQQAMDLQTREQQWQHVIAPQLKRYEAHCSLDLREKTLAALESKLGNRGRLLSDTSARLDASAAEMVKKKSEIDGRASKLENWARELAAFQERAKHLDEEASKIECNEVEQRARHAERLSDLQKERSKIQSEAGELRRRERAITEKTEFAEALLSQAVLAQDSATAKLREAEAINGKLQDIEEDLRASTLANAALQKNVDKLNSEAFGLRHKSTTRVGRPGLEKVCEMSVFRDEAVLKWIFKETTPQQLAVESGYLCTTGKGPWQEDDFKLQLEEQGFNFYRLPDAEVEHIIVGRDDWDGDLLLEQIDSRQGESLRVYSQEMWFAMMATGRDPFDEEDSDLLVAFGHGHPALEFLMNLEFPWPLMSLGNDGGEIEPPDPDDFVSESPLHKLGYTVGMTSGLSVAGRRQALKTCFETKVLEFSYDSSSPYKKSWGASGTAQRLYRMAFHIKFMIDGRVGKDPRKPQSRTDWIADLKWLKSTYYPQFARRFAWPDAAVR